MVICYLLLVSRGMMGEETTEVGTLNISPISIKGSRGPVPLGGDRQGNSGSSLGLPAI
ncbi:MAG: hypothetical protein ACRC8Y_25340 [Chroococcales cyanobacterium]